MPQSEYVVNIIVRTSDQTSAAAGKATKSLGGLAAVAKVVAAGYIAMRAAEKALEFVKLGASIEANEKRLIAFAGGVQEAARYMEALAAGSDNTIDRLTGLAQASRMLETDMVRNAREMEVAAAMVTRLGNQARSTESRMQMLTLLLANQSVMRLDEFGLSIDRVRERQEALEKQGLSTTEAFRAAVFAEAEEKLAILGNTSELAATKIAKIEAAGKDVKVALADLATKTLDTSGILDALAYGMRDLADTTEAVTKEGLAAAAAHDHQSRAAKNLSGEYDRLGRSIQETLWATRGAALNQWALAQATEESADLQIEAALAAGNLATYYDLLAKKAGLVTASEKELAAAQKEVDAYREVQDRIFEDRIWLMERDAKKKREAALADQVRLGEIEKLEKEHQERLAAIYESGQKSRTEIAREAHQQRLEILRDAMQAELEALSSRIDERNWQQRLRDMEANHQAQLARIRDQGRETEAQKENKRHQELLARLTKEQQARLAALRTEYGKGEDADSKKETLEEEHRRRMMGLYTASARKKEQERYQEALKDLEYQSKEAKLLEEFQGEKEEAERRHEAELKRIAENAQQEAVRKEKERYAEEVARAQQARAEQQADADARRAIETKYAADQAALERALALEIAEIERAALAARIAAEQAWFNEKMIGLQNFVTTVNAKAAANPIKIPVTLTSPIAGEHWEAYLRRIGVPGFAEGGVSKGGLAVVGEKGPELLNLPGGTRITPQSRSGAGQSITIINHFGAGSVRSDRDIYRNMELQEKSLRLRGVGAIA